MNGAAPVCVRRAGQVRAERWGLLDLGTWALMCTLVGLAAPPAFALSIWSSRHSVADRSLDEFELVDGPGPSTVEVELDDDDDVGISWKVGNTRHLAQEWFWFRLEEKGEHDDDDDDDWDDDEASPLEIDHLRSHTSTGNQLTLTFEPRSGLEIEIELVLNDMSGDLPDAILHETITITNDTDRDLLFFEFTDWELLGSADDELLSIHFDPAGETGIVQKDGGVVATKKVLPGSDAVLEAYEIGADGDVLDILEDDGGSFADTTSPQTLLGEEDYEWGLQWRVDARDMRTIEQTKALTPEPNTAALLALGLLGLVARRRGPRRR